MKIYLNNLIAFGRSLKPSEKADYSATLEDGKKVLGNTGLSMLILPSSSLPQQTKLNTGIGNLLSKESTDFIDFAKQYWGINTIQLLPEGEIRGRNGIYNPYTGSAFSLDVHNINLEQLTTEKYGKLLSVDDILDIVKANTISAKDTKINCENVIDIPSPTNNALQKAYNNLIKADTTEKQYLLKEFRIFEEKNRDWLEPKSIFSILEKENPSDDYYHWKFEDRFLYDERQLSIEKRAERILELKHKYKTEIDFYNFKQFIAEKHFLEAKKEINNKGIAVNGDMQIAFSKDEVWSNPNAFREGKSTKWGIAALDLESKAGEELLRKKVNKFAKLYDGIRVDAAWMYCNQPIYNACTQQPEERTNYGDKFLNIIEREFKKAKGKDFKPENITYEFIADIEDFNAFDGTRLKPYLKDRIKIYCSNNLNTGWATTKAYKQRGWEDGTYLLGATNHDCLSMKSEFADNVEKRVQQTEVLSDILKIPKEKMQTLNEFIKAKFAEPLSSRHNMIFFSDALNLDGTYNLHNQASKESFKQKIPEAYLKHYFSSLEKGEGYNAMDALAKNFVAKGLDKTNPNLYKKIVKYQKILSKKSHKINPILILSSLGVLAAGLCCYSIFSKKQKSKNL